MPHSHYDRLISDGTITDGDIAAAMGALGAEDMPDLATEVTGIDWRGILADRFGHWAAGYFDLGQALWGAPRRRGAYDAWGSTRPMT